MQLLLNLIESKKIKHDGHPVLRFALSNLVSNVDSSGRWMPDRKNSKEKIDPAVALLMGLRLASLAKPKPKGALFVG
jgi:phage terminase large subunit-like protein